MLEGDLYLTNLRPSEALMPDLNHVKFAETPAVMATHDMTEMELFNIEAEMASSLHDMSNENLLSFAELQEDPVSDEQIELYIWTCFLIFTRTHSTEYLERAIQRTEGWIEVTGLDHPDRARRFQIFDIMSARMCKLTYISEELLPMPMGER